MSRSESSGKVLANRGFDSTAQNGTLFTVTTHSKGFDAFGNDEPTWVMLINKTDITQFCGVLAIVTGGTALEVIYVDQSFDGTTNLPTFTDDVFVNTFVPSQVVQDAYDGGLDGILNMGDSNGIGPVDDSFFNYEGRNVEGLVHFSSASKSKGEILNFTSSLNFPSRRTSYPAAGILIGFASRYAHSIGYRRTVCCIPGADGGAGYSNLESTAPDVGVPAGPSYLAARSSARAFIAMHPGNRITHILRTMASNDTTMSAAAFKAACIFDLETFPGDIGFNDRQPASEVVKIPQFIFAMAPEWENNGTGDNRLAIAADTKNIAGEVDHCVYVDLTGLKSQGDVIHLTNEAQYLGSYRGFALEKTARYNTSHGVAKIPLQIADLVSVTRDEENGLAFTAPLAQSATITSTSRITRSPAFTAGTGGGGVTTYDVTGGVFTEGGLNREFYDPESPTNGTPYTYSVDEFNTAGNASDAAGVAVQTVTETPTPDDVDQLSRHCKRFGITTDGLTFFDWLDISKVPDANRKLFAKTNGQIPTNLLSDGIRFDGSNTILSMDSDLDDDVTRVFDAGFSAIFDVNTLQGSNGSGLLCTDNGTAMHLDNSANNGKFTASKQGDETKAFSTARFSTDARMRMAITWSGTGIGIITEYLIEDGEAKVVPLNGNTVIAPSNSVTKITRIGAWFSGAGFKYFMLGNYHNLTLFKGIKTPTELVTAAARMVD